MHFTMARYGRQRHAVEVIANHVLPGFEGLGTGLIGAYGSGNHLANFFRAVDRQAIGGMSVLLQLRGQGTATGGLARHVQHLGQLGPRRHAESRPVHRRVGQRLLGVEQEAVLNEQQAVDHHRRDRGKG
ncbi:hypothetical protein D3C86_1659890 [compost metagenome]